MILTNMQGYVDTYRILLYARLRRQICLTQDYADGIFYYADIFTEIFHYAGLRSKKSHYAELRRITQHPNPLRVPYYA